MGDPHIPISRAERRPIWTTLQFTVIPFFWLLAGISRHGTHNVPRTGAFIIAPNHTSNLDPIVMGIAVFRSGRTPHFLGKASLFGIPVVGALLRASGQIPVERAGASRTNDPLATAARVAQTGSGVIIYPEGTLTRDPGVWPMRGKTGAVRLALSAGLPIIPAAHWGTERLLPTYAKFPHLVPRKHIEVLYGEPLDLSAYQDQPLDARTIAAATEALMAAITTLVEQLRDETAPPERWDPADHGQTEYGRPQA